MYCNTNYINLDDRIGGEHGKFIFPDRLLDIYDILFAIYVTKIHKFESYYEMILDISV